MVEIEDHTEEIKELVKAQIAVALEAVGQQAEGDVKLNLYPGHGFDTGYLQRSIIHKQDGDDTELIGTATEYAPYVEFGTSRTRPIHFMQEAIQTNIPVYNEILNEHLKNA